MELARHKTSELTRSGHADRMSGALSQRGPGQDGRWVGRHVLLTFHRLVVGLRAYLEVKAECGRGFVACSLRGVGCRLRHG